MGGWIKVEKDLRQDPRVLRMARGLAPLCNVTALHAVTLVLGGLVQLWIFADSFARDDDTLDIGADEINELTGIEGFAQLFPSDWLEILEFNRVKLPGFHMHNSTEAKRRALTGKRVAAHRLRTSVTSDKSTVTQKRYQTETRLDQDHTKTNGEGEHAARAATAQRLPDDFELTGERRGVAQSERVDCEREFARFTDHWRASSGANARKRDWDAAWRNWCRKAADGLPGGRVPARLGQDPEGERKYHEGLARAVARLKSQTKVT